VESIDFPRRKRCCGKIHKTRALRQIAQKRVAELLDCDAHWFDQLRTPQDALSIFDVTVGVFRLPGNVSAAIHDATVLHEAFVAVTSGAFASS
jgi:hypothetical protein